MKTNLLGSFCKLNHPLDNKRENLFWVVQTWLDSEDRVNFLIQHRSDGSLQKVGYQDILIVYRQNY